MSAENIAHCAQKLKEHFAPLRKAEPILVLPTKESTTMEDITEFSPSTRTVTAEPTPKKSTVNK